MSAAPRPAAEDRDLAFRADYYAGELTPPQKQAMAHIQAGRDPMAFAYDRGSRGATRRVLDNLKRRELIFWLGCDRHAFTALGHATWARLEARDRIRTADLIAAKEGRA